MPPSVMTSKRILAETTRLTFGPEPDPLHQPAAKKHKTGREGTENTSEAVIIDVVVANQDDTNESYSDLG